MGIPQHKPASQTASDDIISPVSDIAAISSIAPNYGRTTDKLAAIIAATALGLSILLSGLFFAGFVVNDYHFGAISSALALTLFLGSFAIAPMAIILILARKAYRNGGSVRLYAWGLLLIVPWQGLSILCLIFTPMPIWMSLMAVIFALFLTIWSMISLILELKYRRK